MLRRLSFENYKAFEKGSIELRPLTILLGANSVGKSSILQLLLLLQQTSEADKNYKSALKLNGGFISLGEGLNLFRNKDSSNPLILSFDFKNEDLLNTINSELLKNYTTQILLHANYISKLSSKSSTFFGNILKSIGISQKSEVDFHLEMFLYEKDKKNNKIDRKHFIELLEYISKETNKIDFKIPSESEFIYHFRRPNFSVNGLNNISKNINEFILVYDFLKGLSDLNINQDFKLSYHLQNTTDNTIKINEVKLKSNNKDLFSIEFFENQSNKSLTFKSPIIDANPLKTFIPLDKLNKYFDSNKTIFDFINIKEENSSNESESSIFASTINNILKFFIRSVENNFTQDKINYVSPLRAHPKRYYFLDKAKVNKYLDTLDGDALTEILRENIYLKEQVNTWFSKFNLQIDVDQLRDIIHKLVVKQNLLNLDITDVGFGISQVLPVIVQGFLSRGDSLTIIEQPEIHLHPKMQADLADLFIDIVISRNKKENNKFLLIETHSEYLLKRLRRRISEGTINSKQVAIYLIDPQKDNVGAKLRLLEIEEKGNFEWPTDFYADELIKDTFEFLKNQ